MNSVTSKFSTKVTIDKYRSLKTLVPALGSGRISLSISIQNIPRHEVDVVSSFIFECVFMSSRSLSGRQLGSYIIVDVNLVVTRGGLLTCLEQLYSQVLAGNAGFFAVGWSWQYTKYAQIHVSRADHVHVGKRSQTVVGTAITSIVLEFQIFFFEEGSSIGTESDIAVGDLSCR